MAQTGTSVRPQRLDVYRTAIPMRGFEHAAASRELAESVVVRVQLDDGSMAWGEALPRQYVTGETMDTVIADLAAIFWPAVAGKGISLGDLEGEGLLVSTAPGGRYVTAARCAIELALWNALGGGGGGCIDARVSGVLGSSDPRRTSKRLRLMRLFGLRDFKLKLGLGEAVDDENLRRVLAKIGRGVAAGRLTLRVDCNGAWDAATLARQEPALRAAGVCAIEQPVFCPARDLAKLAQSCPLPLIADESLRTADDARELLAAGPRVWWNIRLAKNGGPVSAMALARQAAQAGIPFVCGCMVGESGILSWAQRRWLGQAGAPTPRFVEGNYGRFLLSDDLTVPSPRFGYGGRLRPASSSGGVSVDSSEMSRYATLALSL